jgi:transcriptional regulator
MYSLPYYKENDEEVVDAFIRDNPFAYLSGCDAENTPVATQIPTFIEEKDGKKVLRGHLMKNTDHHKAFLHNPNVLTVFSGKHTYVSGTWYTDPHIPSTWNYMSVHVKGKIQFHEGEMLEDILQSTSLYFEKGNEASPTVYNNLPVKLRERLIHAIVAFEIEIEDMDTVFKLSQDRDAESFKTIIEKLKGQNADAQVIAAEMEKREKQFFPES